MEKNGGEIGKLQGQINQKTVFNKKIALYLSNTEINRENF